MGKSKNKPFTYIVKVIKTDYEKVEEEIFEMEYEADEHEYESCACATALGIAYNGCCDE